MKVIAVIPARYSSTRFPGKPLADICGKPMIWWVYNNISKSKKFDDVFVAIDDEKIKDVCEKYNIKYVMTKNNHPDHISRVWEVSTKVNADYYICVNGDEPLLNYKDVEMIIPKKNEKIDYFKGAYRKLTDPAETIDGANIKLALNNDGRCVYMSRMPVPFPKNTLMFEYYKYVGIECFSKKGLNFFHRTEMGRLEKIEDIDHLRFLENGKKISFQEINSRSISVDTPKDLEKVRIIMEEKIKSMEG
ncbi:MAG: 3-deoxy-manno-octulosonate cytidylyltransferase [Bacilli bacterium]|nr:3-deoxy-manno-octulosonate cytidylyltransferase [Bacilli bacterium]